MRKAGGSLPNPYTLQIPVDVPSSNAVEIPTVTFQRRQFSSILRPVQQISNLVGFRRSVRDVIGEYEPNVIIAIMFHALATLPMHFGKSSLLVSCIYDIPADIGVGRLDRIVNAIGWKRLAEADIVWASDQLKAELARQIGGLRKRPLVCHNCPPIDYLSEPTRNSELRNQLRSAGAPLGETGGCIIVRAGAVGEHGGIEETLDALHDLPDDYVFLMMGRPPSSFRERIVRRIVAQGLQKRAFLWERPSDSVWKSALQGSDVGHLLHTPSTNDAYLSRSYELNWLLSNTSVKLCPYGGGVTNYCI